MSNLTDSEVKEIRELHRRGSSQRALAKKFKTAHQNISLICSNRTWQHVKDEHSDKETQYTVRDTQLIKDVKAYKRFVIARGWNKEVREAQDKLLNSKKQIYTYNRYGNI